MTRKLTDGEMKNLLQCTFEGDPDITEADLEEHERELLAKVSNKALPDTERAAALDEFTAFLNRGEDLYMHEELLLAVVGIFQDDKITGGQNAEKNPLLIAAINFAAVLGKNDPSYPHKLHARMVDEIMKAHGVTTPKLPGRQPS